MSGLVERVKSVVRSRSKHRQTESVDSTGGRASSDQYALTPEISVSSRSMEDSRRGRVSGEHTGIDGTTRSFATMNMNDRPSTATDTPAKILPPLPSNAAQNIENARVHDGTSSRQSQQRRPLTSEMTMPNAPIHRSNISESNSRVETSNISPEIVSDKLSLTKRKPLPGTKTDTSPHVLKSVASNERDGIPHAAGPRTPPFYKHTRSTDLAPDDPSPLVPHFTIRGATSPNSPTLLQSQTPAERTRDRDLRLPANFNLRNTEHTHIETKVAPAVMAENIHIQRTELVTKAIHKDIHIDHHYNYVQPIPVLEVLPARHFRLDPITGVKTEIPPPPGYKLPPHLEPRKAEDYSHLRQITRHYVVDDEHPYGQLENPPLRHKEDTASLSEQQSGNHSRGVRA